MRKRSGSTAEWRAIAKGPDVLFHICSRADKRGSWTEEDFYAAGRSDWDDFSRHWRHHWPELGGTVVEIGCGGGRLTHVLAETFDRVVALDVSADMIERARRASPGNAEFHQVDGAEVPLADATADGVFSVHVFQHLEDFPMMAAYLAEARRALRPGGSLMVHVTLASSPPPLLRRARAEVELWRSRRALQRGGEHSSVRMNHYRMEDVFRELRRLGFVDTELRVFPVRSDGYHHSFFLARVPS